MSQSLWLKFENNLTDDSGNAVSVTGNGAVAYRSTDKQEGSYSAILNGTNTYYSIASNSLFNFGTSDFVIEFWFKPTSLTNAYQTIFANGETTLNAASRWLMWVSGNKRLYLGRYPVGTDAVFSSPLSENVWHHIVITRNGNNFYLYVNGVLDGSGTDTAAWDFSSNGTLIGRNIWDGANGYFTGLLDSLKIYKAETAYRAYLTRLATETLSTSDPAAALSRLAVEALSTSDVSAALSRLAVEVLSSNKLRKRPITFLILD